MSLGFVLAIIVSGFVTGGLARFALPGPDPMPIWLTITVGLVASIVSGILIGGLLGFILAIVIAALLVGMVGAGYSARTR